MLRSAVLAVALFVPALALACKDDEKSASNQKATPQVSEVTVAQLTQLRKDNKVTTVDANGAETRAKFGVIPGSLLLTSATQFDAAKELPATKDQKLVFYCANTRCTASHYAATRAMSAGYTNVSVLPVGIAGWKSSGGATETPRS